MDKKTSLFEKILSVVAKIPKGKVSTYGVIALFLGLKDARVVGWALHQNKDPIRYPCHRIVDKSGCLSNRYAF